LADFHGVVPYLWCLQAYAFAFSQAMVDCREREPVGSLVGIVPLFLVHVPVDLPAGFFGFACMWPFIAAPLGGYSGRFAIFNKINIDKKQCINNNLRV
jgi:hypothetical protein